MRKKLEMRLDLFGETETAAPAAAAPAPEATASAPDAEGGNAGVEAFPARDIGSRPKTFPAVPKVDVRRPQAKPVRQIPAATQQQPQQQQQAAQPAEETFEDAINGRWKKEFGDRVQGIIQERFKGRQAQDQRYEKAMATLLSVAPMFGINAENADSLDLDQLSQAISDDDRMYEQEALEKGVPTSTLKHIKQLEAREKQRQQEERKSLEQEMLRKHIAGLRDQEAELKKEFPEFDLVTEAQNAAFARMTAPGSGFTVRQAYMALHGDELLQRSQHQAVTETKRAVSQAIQAGAIRPTENGLAQGSGAPQRDPHSYTREERAEIRRRVMAGETGIRP